MLIDIILLLLMVAAIVRGYTTGLIIAVFSVLALLLGLAAAMKLSVVTAARLHDAVHIAAKWLPVIAFALVFIIVALLVRLAATALRKTLELAFLGWADKLGGVLLYMALYLIILSVVLFYAEKISLLPPDTIAASKTYHFIKPLGPKAVNMVAAVMPFFKGMFQQLEGFFVSNKI